ncbi:outer membrane protein assembly factor BamD [Pelodictyon luteolum]|uniref:Putative lipoprotein n=1 Tax=Chlorobium luteolum (strain DSM 273 / BCRC 81028 / 2530) TaxID=319225 RepID=Q3B145_CHLL3|nr:outer membrane protein assembly factor BamD [Pelodictyon luteolum]ABB24936.1 putative lipoprotein [Pelodictyon luteolum DSM 273]
MAVKKIPQATSFSGIRILPLLLLLSITLTLASCSSSRPKMSAEEQVSVAYRNATELYQKKEYENAAASLEPQLFASRATPLEDDVLFLLAQSYYASKQYLLSSDMYDRLLQQVPSSPYREASRYMLAKSYEQLSPAYERDQEYTRRAIEAFSEYLAEYSLNDAASTARDLDTYSELLKIDPSRASYQRGYEAAKLAMARQDSVKYASAAIPVLHDKLGAATYSIATQYVKLKKYKAAAIYFENVVRNYGDTPWMKKAQSGLVEVQVKRGKWFDARRALDSYLQSYPEDLEEMKDLREEIMRNFSNS